MKWLVFFVFVATPLSAETILVQTGEHADFSRVVLSPTAKTSWDLVETEQGYRLKFGRKSISFDLSSAFNLIPRDRIEAIVLGDEVASLDFVLKPSVIARGFETANRDVVIDFSTRPEEEAVSTADIAQREPLKPIAKSVPISTQFYWRGIVPDANTDISTSQAPAPTIAPNFEVPKDDTRIAEAEQQLLTQLSRAASQGLVKIAPPEARALRKQTVAEAVVEAAPRADASMTAESSEKNSLAYQMQTAIDREMPKKPEALSYTGAGAECLLDADFDFSSWVNGDPPATQIADARRKLIGEFDKASRWDVIDLAKLYLGLSFGAEAQAVLAAFNPETDEKETLVYLARVLDNLPVDEKSPILGMVECDTAASLWALLGSSQPQPDSQINFSAVQRAYSALPHALRLAVTDPLIEKLILNKASGSARIIRKIAARIEPEGDILKMSDARLDLASGDTEQAERGLEGVVAENGHDAVDALLLLVDTQFENGDLTSPKTVENVAALAFENRLSADGVKLTRALVLAATAAHQYERATHELQNWSVDESGTRSEVAAKVFGRIVREADDVEFLSASMDNSELWDAKNADVETRIRAGERYLELGFPDQAIDLLSQDQLTSTQVAKLVAHAHLLRGNGGAALSAVQRLSDSESGAIRAEALAMMQQPKASADAFIASGDTESAGRQAWKAGAWDLTSRVGSAEEKEALASLALTQDPTRVAPNDGVIPDVATGPIGQGQRLIDESARMRAALDALLTSQQ